MERRMLTTEDFNNLKAFGHVVPRTTNKFKVSSLYVVFDGVTGKELTVKCTQNSPINLKVIES